MSSSRQGGSAPRQVPNSPAAGDGGNSHSRTTSTARLASPVPSSMMSPIPQIPTPPAEFQSGTNTPLAGNTPGSPSRGPGRSALASAIEGHYPRSPPRHGTPALRTDSPGLTPQASISNIGHRGSNAGRDRRESDVVSAMEDPEVVARHLVHSGGASQADPRSVSRGRNPHADRDVREDEFSSLQLQGGDIHREIYRWSEQAQNEATVQRSKSFSVSRAAPEAASLRLPGAMRREYHHRTHSPFMSGMNSPGFGEAGVPYQATSNFLQFLTLYGHFAGEDLEEDDDNEDAIEEEVEEAADDERTPLVRRPTLRKRGTSRKGKKSGDQTWAGALGMLLKSFVGTGILFLPRAFANGGMLFSVLVLIGVAGLSYYCFILLIGTRKHVDASFGELGGILYGPWLKGLILGSLVLSQVGFVSAYTVFVAENLRAFAFAVSKCAADVDLVFLILAQLAVFLPMSLLRDISKLSWTALVADAFILIGILYLAGFDISVIVEQGGWAPSVVAFNPLTWSQFIGTAVFTFEGIGLILPIQESMKKPQEFSSVLFVTMAITTVLFTGMGALSYATFGADTKTVVLLNLPQEDKFVNAVQFLYAIAILLSTPLQLFPAIRILENALFTRSGKANFKIKWYKNFFRFFLVIVCAMIAWGGAGDLDKFVSLVGSFACVPLVYIYPPLLHYKAAAKSRIRRILDLLLAAFGIGVMAYTSSLTISSWASGSNSGGGTMGPPDFCKT